jgi:hypothetical protein
MDIFAFLPKKEETEADKRFRNLTKLYNKWLMLPEKTLIKEGTPERKKLNSTLWENYCKLYGQAYHECDGIPQNEYIWLNPCDYEYWVLNQKGTIGGKHIEICPYCGAKLGNGEGNAYLYKADYSYQLFYLYWEVPMHERGYQSPEERQRIKERWG